MTLLLQQARASLHIPEAPRQIEASRGQVAPERVESDARQARRVARQDTEALAGGRPQRGAGVGRSRRERGGLHASVLAGVGVPCQTCESRGTVPSVEQQ